MRYISGQSRWWYWLDAARIMDSTGRIKKRSFVLPVREVSNLVKVATNKKKNTGAVWLPTY